MCVNNSNAQIVAVMSTEAYNYILSFVTQLHHIGIRLCIIIAVIISVFTYQVYTYLNEVV